MATQSSTAARVLLVEDDPTVRGLLIRLMQSYGLEIASAENGNQAMQLFEQETYDLLLTDLYMPEMNGWELIRTIRERDPKLPIIALSAYATPEQLGDLESCHARLFSKPLNFRVLHAYIDELLRAGSKAAGGKGKATADKTGGGLSSQHARGVARL